MASDLVVWSGPIYKQQAPGATVPGAKELWLGCYGDRDPFCPDIGNKLRGSYANLLAEASLPPSWQGRTFLGAFSAGGSTMKRLLENSEYRDRVTAVLLSDATYTSTWIDQKNRVPPPIEGFVLYALDAISESRKMFVATASPINNKIWASGIENLRAIRAEIEKRSGQKFVKLDHFYGVDPGPDAAYQLGNVILAEYPLKPIGHGHNQIAGQVWQNILWPWLEGKTPVPPPPAPPPPPEPPGPVVERSVGALLSVALGVAVGFVGGPLLARAARELQK